MTFDDALENFMNALQTMVDEYYIEKFDNLKPPDLVIHEGHKFLKIITVDNREASGRVWGFVAKVNGNTKALGEYKTGDIMKAATWTQPAKHARGSIFNSDPLENMGVFSPNYLK